MAIGTLPPGTLGGDCDQEITGGIAKALYGSGIRFVLRYISRGMGQRPGDLTTAERWTILGAGLALGYVQHVQSPPWIPSLALGHAYGAAMAANMESVRASHGATAWLDWEGVDLSTPETSCVAYINGWAHALTKSAPYVPGIYVGYDSILSPDQLYYDLAPTRYWKSESRVAAPSLRGWCMIQAIANPPAAAIAAGLSDWDSDTIVSDAFGGLPVWDLPP